MRLLVLWAAFALAAILPLSVEAQDAAAVIDASAKAMGTTTLQAIRYTGSGTNNSLGQAFNSGGPWPRFKVTKFVALVNYTIPAMRQEIVRIDNESPPRGGGAGPFNPSTGQGGIRPIPGDIIQNQNADGRAEAGALTMWLTPHGFLKGAVLNGGARLAGTQGKKRVLTDGDMTLEIHLVRGNLHSEGLLMAYIPKQKLLIQADTFTPRPGVPPLPSPSPYTTNLVENVERLKLSVERVAHVHGGVDSWQTVLKLIGRGGSN